MTININPQNAGDWGTFVGGMIAFLSAIVAFVMWPYKTFLTQKAAKRIYLMRLEDNGSTQYVRKEDWDEMKVKMDKSFEQGEKWQRMAKDWMERP